MLQKQFLISVIELGLIEIVKLLLSHVFNDTGEDFCRLPAVASPDMVKVHPAVHSVWP